MLIFLFDRELRCGHGTLLVAIDQPYVVLTHSADATPHPDDIVQQAGIAGENCDPFTWRSIRSKSAVQPAMVQRSLRIIWIVPTRRVKS